jgi:hypothetical protein
MGILRTPTLYRLIGLYLESLRRFFDVDG